MKTFYKNPLSLGLSCCVASLGFNVASTLADQQWSYTYNNLGQMASSDGPRTDVSDVTLYQYDQQGNRIAVTNALGQQTQLLDYNASGQPRRLVDANGVETLLSYHPRGWLASSTLKDPAGDGAQDATTAYAYDGVGQLIKITQPDGAEILYEYDTARRLIAVSNQLGERIDYELDTAGNRTGETIRSGSGDIKKTLSRVYDELSRVIQLAGGSGQVTDYSYDLNSNNIELVDGRSNSTQQQFDALNRLTRVIDADSQAANYEYDSQDRISRVTDQRGLSTQYHYDAFGNLTGIDSPDTGATGMVYDEAGNLVQRTDARGVVSQYQYDALNRLLAISYPASPEQNITYVYDQVEAGSFGVGRLTRVTKASGSSQYRYDHRGNVTALTTVIASRSYTTAYDYDLAGRLQSMTYPSGRQLWLQRDSQGRVAALSTQGSADNSPQTLAQDIRYLPFGPVSGLQFGNGVQLNLSHDLDYRLTHLSADASGVALQDASYQYDGASNITHIDDGQAAERNQLFVYDKLNRLTDAGGVYGGILFDYDAVGNRLQRVIDSGAEIQTQDYQYDLNSNRLLSVDSGSGLRLFDYDASGNIILDDRGDHSSRRLDYSPANRLSGVTLGEGTEVNNENQVNGEEN